MKKNGLSESFLKNPPMASEDEFICADISALDYEIDLIHDVSIKKFVRFLLKHAPAFWKAPGFHVSGMHPEDEDGEGGLVLHTKRVVRIAVLLSSSLNIETGVEMDCLIAAAILHDISKYTSDETVSNLMFDEMHPYTVDRYVKWSIDYCMEKGKAEEDTTLEIDQDELELILRLIRCSHGIWSPVPETIPLSNLEMVLHQADLIAAQLHVVSKNDKDS